MAIYTPGASDWIAATAQPIVNGASLSLNLAGATAPVSADNTYFVP